MSRQTTTNHINYSPTISIIKCHDSGLPVPGCPGNSLNILLIGGGGRTDLHYASLNGVLKK